MLELLFPHKCCVCGKLLDINTHVDSALCDECLKLWNEEREKTCSRCGRTAQFCRCSVKLNKTAIVSYYSSCVLYEGEFVKKVIATLKYKRQKKLMRFAVHQILNNIYLMYDVDFSDCIIAYPPRSRASLKKYGFDHAKILAEMIAEQMNIPVFHGIFHRGDKEQKYLDYESRAKNAFESFYIKNRDDAKVILQGKTVLLVDDVLTSGSTAICISVLLHNCGVQTVKFFSVARTPSPYTRNV